MHREPEKRFATCAEMQRAVDEAMAQLGTAATTDVAAFIRLHLAESEQTRKRAVQVALEAAGERAKRNSPLEEPLSGARSSASSSVDSAEPGIRSKSPSVSSASLRKPLNVPSESGVSPSPLISDSLPTVVPAPQDGAEHSLGDGGVPGVPDPLTKNRRVVGISAAFTAVTLVAVLALAFTRGGKDKEPTSGAGSATATTATATSPAAIAIPAPPNVTATATATAAGQNTAAPETVGTWPSDGTGTEPIDLDAKDAGAVARPTMSPRPTAAIRTSPTPQPRRDAGAPTAAHKCPNGGVWPRCNDGF
jgi:hypothetical protein